MTYHRADEASHATILADLCTPFQLNVFHWHIVDTQSFPVELSDEPTTLMSQYGAYGPAQIYTRDDIVDIVQYANLKGDSEKDSSLHLIFGFLYRVTHHVVSNLLLTTKQKLCFSIRSKY